MPTGRLHITHTRARRPSVTRRIAAVVVSGACATATLVLAPGSSLADPPVDEPTIEQVRVQVDELYAQLETAAETANEARSKAEDVRSNLETLRANLEKLQDDLDDASASAGAFAAAQYRSAGIDPTVQLLVSDDPSSFLTRMSQLGSLAEQQSRAVDSLTSAALLVETQQAAIERESARLDALEATTVEAEAQAQAKLDEANALLDRLTAEEEARLAAARAAAEAREARAAQARYQDEQDDEDEAATSPAPPPPAGDASGRAQIAVNFAMSQIGHGYAYGGTGPRYDCSGLTMMSWRAAGVSLPHSASGQKARGTPVSASELRPGDLVFYYFPIRHVAMYIGNGMIVHASNYSHPVGTAPLYSMPYNSAVRIG